MERLTWVAPAPTRATNACVAVPPGPNAVTVMLAVPLDTGATISMFGGLTPAVATPLSDDTAE